MCQALQLWDGVEIARSENYGAIPKVLIHSICLLWWSTEYSGRYDHRFIRIIKVYD
jgi:hypothetical protein